MLLPVVLIAFCQESKRDGAVIQVCIFTAVVSARFLQQKALEAAAAKDAKDVVSLASNSFNSLNKKLIEKYKHIEALNAKYQQVS